MDSSEAVNEMELYRVSGVIASAHSVSQKALLIEKEIGLDTLYSMISMGTSEAQMASGLGLSTYEMKVILRRTPDHRRKMTEAVAFQLAEASVPMLKQFSKKHSMFIETSAAAKHHMGMFALSAKLAAASKTDKSGSSIVVHNTVHVRNASEIPALPDGLEILEGEFEDAMP